MLLRTPLVWFREIGVMPPLSRNWVASTSVLRCRANVGGGGINPFFLPFFLVFGFDVLRAGEMAGAVGPLVMCWEADDPAARWHRLICLRCGALF